MQKFETLALGQTVQAGDQHFSCGQWYVVELAVGNVIRAQNVGFYRRPVPPKPKRGRRIWPSCPAPGLVTA